MKLSENINKVIETLKKLHPNTEYRVKDDMILEDGNFLAWINDGQVNLNKLPELRRSL